MDAPIRVDLNYAATMVVLHVLLELSLQSTTTRGSVHVEGISSSFCGWRISHFKQRYGGRRRFGSTANPGSQMSVSGQAR